MHAPGKIKNEKITGGWRGIRSLLAFDLLYLIPSLLSLLPSITSPFYYLFWGGGAGGGGGHLVVAFHLYFFFVFYSLFLFFIIFPLFSGFFFPPVHFLFSLYFSFSFPIFVSSFISIFPLFPFFFSWFLFYPLSFLSSSLILIISLFFS